MVIWRPLRFVLGRVLNLITDLIWEQLQVVMKEKGCYRWAGKIHIAADSHGNPIDFEITGGEVLDTKTINRKLKT